MTLFSHTGTKRLRSKPKTAERETVLVTGRTADGSQTAIRTSAVSKWTARNIGELPTSET